MIGTSSAVLTTIAAAPVAIVGVVVAPVAIVGVVVAPVVFAVGVAGGAGFGWDKFVVHLCIFAEVRINTTFKVSLVGVKEDSCVDVV